MHRDAPSDLIRRTRLAAAARLLEARSGTVADVALANSRIVTLPRPFGRQDLEALVDELLS